MEKVHSIKIEAELLVQDEPEGPVPAYVRVKNAGFHRPSAIMDIAQEVLDSHYDARHPYIAMLPDAECIDDDMNIKVIARKI